MRKAVSFLRDNLFLVLVATAYLALFILMPERAAQSVRNSLYYIREMLMIMPVVLLLTALINAWVPKKTIERSLGQNSGVKGAIFAFLLGSFSAGPIYAAFPVCKTLLRKGASISNIVILLSTWAVVKIPMLLNEAKFLGPRFMLARWVLTTISIFIMGWAAARLVSPKDLPQEQPAPGSGPGIIRLTAEYCVGCGLCASIAPDYFVLEGKAARVIKDEPTLDGMPAVNKAISQCPASIISLG